jgi:hypothetical protein
MRAIVFLLNYFSVAMPYRNGRKGRNRNYLVSEAAGISSGFASFC